LRPKRDLGPTLVVAITLSMAVAMVVVSVLVYYALDGQSADRATAEELVRRNLPMGTSVIRTLTILHAASFTAFSRDHHYNGYTICTRNNDLAGCYFDLVDPNFRPKCSRCSVITAAFGAGVNGRELTIFLYFDRSARLSSFLVNTFEPSM
jgi:hypothetical protein